ncbi:hypothetical protein N7517_009662 [Penicillium concentricum]|uniref:Xylanolytic transcriptional activator regulatory domain-containing protein n=1 Tax=Penicillium concentricum TaxID=293559 RepID=A0A9W9RI40_9EURO|nr:uncharacterized protein N7517_009662 [Penicillium concentricum]KAJ5360471.1 hypothetical protein N7517_009662 [Penicillium concentricum]
MGDVVVMDKDGLGAPQTVGIDHTPEFWTEPQHTSPDTIENAPFLSNVRVDSSKWLPEYASPMSPSITSADCHALNEQGAFNVPGPRIRAGILNGYFQFVHPELPILSPEDFLMVLDKGYSGSRGISFLLFQAVIFAATAFQTADSLALEGFNDRREARQERFERIKLLYSYGCEEDRITILQSVLLMTYWDDTSNQSQDAWHFLGLKRAQPLRKEDSFDRNRGFGIESLGRVTSETG